MLPAFVPVDNATRVAEVRRLAGAAADAEGLGQQAAGELAIIATEIATNLLRHARAGEVQITRLSGTGERGVEILSIDRGPGVASIQTCAADGFSTAGTAGTGLGAIRRLADVFDAWSQPGKGTVLVARKFQQAKPSGGKEDWCLGAVRVAYPGEETCGDDWSVRRTRTNTAVIVADGLGHGLLASEASRAAVHTFLQAPCDKASSDSPAFLLEEIHLALHSTRGAAVAIARLEHGSRLVRYAGLGNICGVLLGGARPRYMLSHSGTAGHAARRFQEFDYELPADAAIVMHSDGITTSWSLDPYPGLLRRHPSVIAGILYRDAIRGRDDVCVVVGRYIRE